MANMTGMTDMYTVDLMQPFSVHVCTVCDAHYTMTDAKITPWKHSSFDTRHTPRPTDLASARRVVNQVGM